MAQVNIFGNIDVTGILKDYKTQIDNFYGGDPTTSNPSPSVLAKIIDPNFAPLKLGYWNINVLPSYTRLVSSKDSTLGYEIRTGDTVTRNGKTYLTNTYNLTVMADNGDDLRWWGHSIAPNIQNQAIIANINNPGSSTAPPPQFGTLTNSNITFYNAAGAVNPANLMDGLNIATRSAFCINGKLTASSGQSISYDIDILVMSAPLTQGGSLLTYPIVKVVVDPVIIVR
ncbi:MAG: hypothetical protein V3T17_17705 [Pseudomonadales bacterium]